MKKTLLPFLVLFVFASNIFAQESKLTARLMDLLDATESNEYIRTLVILNDQVDVASMDANFYLEKASIQKRTREVIAALKQKAANTQGSLKNYLKEKELSDEVFRYQPFWVVNMIMVEATPAVINEMAARPEVYMIDKDGDLYRDLPVGPELNAPEGIESVEPGLKIINADKLWKLGITGAGRIVMGIDTGVDVTHPALSYKWRGTHVPADQAWLDPSGGTSTPNDCDTHGTHTMGTMTGRSTTTSDTVGVAIDAEWIASNSLCGGGSHTSRTIQSFQWAMDPDGDSTTIDDMPDAISNSWYDPNISDECNSIYKTTLDAVEAVGIAVVFSAGNSGPGSQTITTPKNINTDEVNVWATGAIDGALYLSGSTNPIASFSSRGPSSCGGSGSLLIKPEASAPGVSVRSSVPGGGYGTKSGTSMAAPHVAGAIALLKQYAPQLTGKQIKLALYNTAEDLGTAGEDNTYGMGLIDVYAAFLSLGTPDTTAPDQITDLAVIDTTSNSLTLTWTVPNDTSLSGVVSYDIRMSNSMINDTADFNGAVQIPFTKQPADSGETEMLIVENLNFSTDYYFAIRAGDVWGNMSVISNNGMGTTFEAPGMNVTPDSLHMTMVNSTSLKDTFYISNVSAGNSTLDYNIQLTNNTFPEGRSVIARILPVKNKLIENSPDKFNPKEIRGMAVEGFGGPDAFGYEWIDSDELDGPVYVWDDISATGSEATSWTATGSFDPKDEGYAGPINIGFPFKFYGAAKTEVYISSNGMIAFAPITSNIFTNSSIPSSSTPNEFIAPFWDDLDGKTTGKVYYKQDADKFTIQYTDWLRFSGSGSYTFQVVLYSSGKIIIYYKSMTATLTGSSVGIENADGTDGLQVAFNSSYIKNNLALQFNAEPDWLTADNYSGRIYNGNTAAVELTFDSQNFLVGDYSMDVVINGNDPVTPQVIIPVTMTIEEIPVELTSFNASVEDKSVELIWKTATETNNQGFDIEKKYGKEGSWKKLGFREGKVNSTITNTYNFVDSFDEVSFKGSLWYRIKQIDMDGTFTYFQPVEVDVNFAPKEFKLEQNYPNPFNPVTTIKYSLPNQSSVKLQIFNVLGEVVDELVNTVQETGYYEIQWNAGNNASGIYIYSIQAESVNGKDQYRNIKKMILMK